MLKAKAHKQSKTKKGKQFPKRPPACSLTKKGLIFKLLSFVKLDTPRYEKITISFSLH